MVDPADLQTSRPLEKPHKDDDTPTFEFGKNWETFLESLTEERFTNAQRSLSGFLMLDDLAGRSFLDIGCGSGLFSWCAHRLGAGRIESFDVDAMSVRCCEHLRTQAGEPTDWHVRRASILDDEIVEQLGEFDVVYAWGSLHHTGNMWRAIGNAASRVAPGGYFYLAIYNDKKTGVMTSRNWLRVKKIYNRASPSGKRAIIWIYGACLLLTKVLAFENPFHYLREYRDRRGMSWTADIVDWIGGYPYEYTSVQALFDFHRRNHPDFYLANLKTAKGIGCHELLFRRFPDLD